MNTYCTFYIVRHGQTDWNVAKKMQGQKNSHLTEFGKKQLLQTKNKVKDVVFHAIFASDLERSMQSAEIIKGERQLPIKASPLLRERSYGKHEGKKLEEFKEFEAILEKLSDKERFFHKMDTDIESDQELMKRLQQFLKPMIQKYQGQTVLVVSHGAVMQAFLIMIGFGTYSTLLEKFITNGSYAKIKTDGKDFIVDEVWGITKHE